MAIRIKLPRREQAFCYLMEMHHDVTPIERLDCRTVISTLPLPDRVGTWKKYELSIDERDHRVLVIVDGYLLPECFSHNGKLIHEEWLCDPETNLRNTRLPEPYYDAIKSLPFVPHGSSAGSPNKAAIRVHRYFLLLPVKTNAVFVRPRDLRSLGPMYTFIEVDVENDKPIVRWRNTSW